MAEPIPFPLREEPSVAELLDLLKQSGNEAPFVDFNEMVMFAENLTNQFNAVVNELHSVKNLLSDMEERQQHPVKTRFHAMVNNLETMAGSLRERITELRQSIVEGAKAVLAAFKEKGMAVLDGVMRFFKVKEGLESIKADLDKDIQANTKTIGRIDAMAAEVHEVGAHVKNIGRAARGKELLEKRENGKVAKALQAPVRAVRKLNSGMRKGTVAMIAKLDRLEQAVVQNKEAAAEKPSVLKTLESNKEIVARRSSQPLVAAATRRPQEATL